MGHMAGERFVNAENHLREKPIPSDIPSVAGWKDIPLIEPAQSELLVPLGPFSTYDHIATSSVYFGEHNNSPYQQDTLGGLATVFVREGVARQLHQAQTSLPRGMHFVVLDAYRPVEVQRALYDTYFNELKSQHGDWTEDQLSAETQKYVSLPKTPKLDPAATFVSPHNTGGAVDLAIFQMPDSAEQQVQAFDREVKGIGNDVNNWQRVYELQMRKIGIINQKAKPLNFGTTFDYGGAEAALNYFEVLAQERILTTDEREAQQNRRLLYNVMIDAGFEPYADEWWHFNAKKSQMGAKTAGLHHAEYGAIELSSMNQKHETMRSNHRLGTIRMFEGATLQNKVSPFMEVFTDAKRAAIETGDIRISNFPETEVIKPPKVA